MNYLSKTEGLSPKKLENAQEPQ